LRPIIFLAAFLSLSTNSMFSVPGFASATTDSFAEVASTAALCDGPAGLLGLVVVVVVVEEEVVVVVPISAVVGLEV
jgi:hypothetical protein